MYIHFVLCNHAIKFGGFMWCSLTCYKVNVGNSGRSLHSRSLSSDSRSNRLQTCAVFWYTIQLSINKN